MTMTLRGATLPIYLIFWLCRLYLLLILQDVVSEMSAVLPSEVPESGKSSYPPLGLGTSFTFKFEDLKGRVHRVNSGKSGISIVMEH